MFKELGYFKEYYVNNKYVGTLPSIKDRDIIGYNGKQKEMIITQIKFKNNKLIKKGTEVETFLYPLCGIKI